MPYMHDDLMEASGEVAVALVRSKGRRDRMPEVNAYAEGIARKRARAVAETMRGCPPGPWAPAHARALATNGRMPVMASVGSERMLRSTHPIVLKAVRLAHALANDDASGLATGELRWMVGALADTYLGRRAGVMLAARLAGPHPGPGDAVPFSFAWRHVRPRSKVLQDIHLGAGVVALARIPAAEAPVVARLSSPLGAAVEVRHHRGALYRPVMAPGRWEPVAPGEFAAAAAAGVAWVDSPFQPPLGDHEVILGAADYAGPPPARADAAAAAGEALLAATVRAGRLAVIDGVVHRSTPPPTLHVDVADRWTPDAEGGHVGESFGLSLAWSFPDGFGMHVGQGTLARPDTTARDYLRELSPPVALPAVLGDALDLALADLVADPPADQDGTRSHAAGNPVEVLDPEPFEDPWLTVGAAMAALSAQAAGDGPLAPMQPLDKPGLLARLARLRDFVPEVADPGMDGFAP